jgi:hypothetical protein
MKQQDESIDKHKYNPNAPETEEDGLIAGKLRLSKVLQQSNGQQDRIHNLLTLLSSVQQTTKSTSKDLESFELNVTSEHIKLMNEENLDKKDKRLPLYLDPELSQETDSPISSARQLRKLRTDIAKEFTGLNEGDHKGYKTNRVEKKSKISMLKVRIEQNLKGVKVIIGILLFGYYNYKKKVNLNNGVLKTDEFRSFLMKKTSFEWGSFCIKTPNKFGASNYEDIKPHWVEDHNFNNINLEINKEYKKALNYWIELDVEDNFINSIEIRTGDNFDPLLINLIVSSMCPLFLGYEILSIYFLIWAISFSMIRLYTVIKIQNDLKRVVLHLEYLYKIHALEAKQE